MYFVGIDAGGTKTDFLLCDENEKQIKRVTLGAGNPNDIGIDACISLLSSGLDELCRDIVPDAVFAGVSGGGYGENAERIRTFLKRRFPDSAVDNGPDALNLIYCSESRGNVGALICGTGSVFFLRTEQELLRFGGWGHLFDNGGSAYDIGRDALRFMLDCEEILPSALNSPLCLSLRDKLSASAHDSITAIYSKGKSYIASLAPLVFEAYARGDATAAAIIESNVNSVAARISLAKSTVDSIDEIVCAGGLFNSSAFFELLSKKVDVPLVLLSIPPVVGACRGARNLVSLC